MKTSKSLESLEQQRAGIANQIAALGDLRSGSVTSTTDLEAVEMAVRSALHRAGAATLSRLLQFTAPAANQRTLPCPCGHQAHYRELRTKTILTAVGQAELSRPYYLCSHCHSGQFPADI